MTNEEILEHITAFADQAHGDQMRKYTQQRYIVHPVEVMQLCNEVTNDMSILAAALLHDVLEDTPTTTAAIKDFLQQFFDAHQTERTMQLVVDLTDIYTKKDYPQLNRRARKSRENERLSKADPDAQSIKYADIISNSRDFAIHDRDFAKVYYQEMKTLLALMNKGNNRLHRKALETLEACIK